MEGTRDDYDDTTDAAQAFDELRAEVAVMRRAVEALPGAWEAHRPPDYSPDLGHIAHGLAAVVDQLDAMHQLPALRMTPDQYSQAVSEAISQAGHGLKLATHDVQFERQQLAALIGTARRQDQQRTRLVQTALAAFVVGLLAAPVVAGALPFGLDGRIAAFIMKADRWEAGSALMRTSSPDDWREVVDASHLVQANQKDLAACRQAAARTKHDARCTITVPAASVQ